MTFGGRTKPTPTCQSPGHGRLTRLTSGPSKFPHSLVARARAWQSHGPDTFTDKGGIRNQFAHVIDIVPTLLEATGIPTPVMVDGIAQKPIEGVSMAYTFDK